MRSSMAGMFSALFGRKHGRDKSGNRSARANRWRPQLEQLETRVAPACSHSQPGGVVTINCDGANDTIALDRAGGHHFWTTYSGGPSSGVSWAAASVTGFVFNGGAGNDLFRIMPGLYGGTPRDLDLLAGKPVTLNSGPGTDTTQIYDNANPFGHQWTITGSNVSRPLANINYFGMNGGLVLETGNGFQTFVVNSTHSSATILSAGTGNDTFLVRATSGLLNIQGTGGTDGVHVGNTSNSVQSILGTVNIDNTLGFNNITIANQGHTLGRTATVTGGGVTGLAPAAINWNPLDTRSVTINGSTVHSGAGNVFHINGTPCNGATIFGGVVTTVNSGAGSVADTVNVRATCGLQGARLNVNGQSGEDNVNLGNLSSVQSIQGNVHISNATSYSSVVIDNRNNSTGRTATLTASGLTGLAPAAVTWVENDLRYLEIFGSTVSSGAGNTFHVNGTPASTFGGGLQTVIHTGSSASIPDTVNVRATSGSGGARLTVDGVDGRDNVNIHNLSFSVQSILGAVHVANSGGNGFTVLVIQNSGDTIGRTATLTSTGLTGLAAAAITWVERDLLTLFIYGSTVSSGPGNTFHVNGTPGSNFASGLLTTILAGSSPSIPDTVNVRATSGFNGARLTVEGQNGQDVVNIGSTSGSARSIFGTVHVSNNGSNGFTALTVTNSGDTVGREAFLTATSLTGLAPATISWDQVDLRSLTIQGSTVSDGAGNIFHVNGTPGNPLYPDGLVTTIHSGNGPVADTVNVRATSGEGAAWLSIDGQEGSDTVVGPASGGTWSVTSADVGTVTGPDLGSPVNFFSVENLISDASDDYFALSDGAGLSGFLWDVGGNALLDYSAYSSGVYVNLTTFEATGIAGGVYGIPNVVGSAGDDILVGDDASNYLDGGPGRDLVIGGGAGYSGIADYLVGGEGEDIVIGGFTAYDADGGALFAILAEWAQPTDYYERVANLYAGATAPALNEGTVFYNHSYGNVLLGEEELDLFFGDPSYDFSDWDPEAEGFVQVF